MNSSPKPAKLPQGENAGSARVHEGIRQGLAEMKAGRGKPADEVFAEIRRELLQPRSQDDLL